ncbi:hypothetical protein [Leucobacter massiliensis]|uniref:hypothetical protein n=1 Tax=Leucobacter massiliensis TaxID=1686285 RepID=UPI0011B1CC30|nr:hypothetical protein [Leucobacter massiliensis]
MECATITCNLDEIAAAISEPSAIEEAALVVAVASAAGTLAIALLNVFLLMKQHRLQVDTLRKEGRVRRAEYGAALKAWVIEAIADRAHGRPNGHSRTSAAENEVARLGALTDERTHDRLASFVATSLVFKLPAPKDRDGLGAFAEQLITTIDAWVSDPSSVELDSAAVIAGA